MCKYERSIGVPFPVVNPSQFRRQVCSKPPDDNPWRRGIPYVKLRVQPLSDPLPEGVVGHAPVQVRPIVLVGVITIHLHQQRGQSLKVCALLHKGLLGRASGIRGLSIPTPRCMFLVLCKRYPMVSTGAAMRLLLSPIHPWIDVDDQGMPLLR